MNIVIIGMPGVGKTSVAREIARVAKIPAIDIDEEITARYGPIPKLFERGEAYFRALEKREVERAAKERGVVIATGGGSILDADNVRHLRESGILYWIRRPLEKLARDGRPLSAGGMEAIETMWEERKGLYARAAQKTLKNTTIPATARAILQAHRALNKNA